MKEEYCKIYNLCFPKFYMTFERFQKLMHNNKCVYFEQLEENEIVAFAIVEDYAVKLLCVTPSRQLSGIGSKLLKKIEVYLKEQGYGKSIIGGVNSQLFLGAVAKSWGFFEKHGYQTSGGCDEMILDLKEFVPEYSFLHGHDIAEYSWYDGDMEDIHKAVASVDESWIQYYEKPGNIYVARVDGEIASFCLVDVNCQNYLTDAYGKIGMPGCVGTVPKYRNKGIALEMIANATNYLKNQGMDVSFIFYTGVAQWYEKLGYKTILTEIFCEKSLN